MPTLLEGIADKYEHNDEDYGGFIVFVSSSPDVKKGMFPPIMSLCDYSLEHVGTHGLSLNRLTHIAELDLTENCFSHWSEVLRILDIFPNLTFLNMSKNNLCNTLVLSEDEQMSRRSLPLKKLVLNSNKIDWPSLNYLVRAMPFLEELHLSNNALRNPAGEFGHENLKTLFLTCNEIDCFTDVQRHLGTNCPNLTTLSLAECPIADAPKIDGSLPNVGLGKLVALNVNATKISTWEDVDNFRTFPALQELRIRGCPLMEEYTAHERRSLLVARLPNVSIFNGGDKVPANEREDAERAFIRFYLDDESKPRRFHELVTIHGELNPLVNISMKPDIHVKVTISAKQESDVREHVISVYQTVAQFKSQLHQWFQIPVQNMRLYYCDQVLVKAAGPEEMKWAQKALYTYNVRDGDSFILDEKTPLTKLKANSRASNSATSPKAFGKSPTFPSTRYAVTMAAINPKTFGGKSKPPKSPNPRAGAAAAGVARNLFPDQDPESNNNNLKQEKNHSAGS